MTSDAQAEYERIKIKYAPARLRDLAFFALVIGLLVAANLVFDVDWAFVLGGIAGLAFWEFTKFRLRRNARDFAQHTS